MSFGISDIDKLLGGGLLPGSGYLLEVEAGTQEMPFLAAFLGEGLRQRDLLGILLFDMAHEEFFDRLMDFDVDVRQALDSGSLIVADLWEEGKYDPERKGPVLMTENPNDPNAVLRMYYELGETILTRFKSGRYTGIRGVICSLSSQLMTYKFERTYKMVRRGLQLSKDIRTTILSVLNPMMFDKTVVASFEHVSDGIIVLTMKETKDEFQRYIWIKRSPIASFSTKIVPYGIVDKKPLLAKQSGEPIARSKEVE